MDILKNISEIAQALVNLKGDRRKKDLRFLRRRIDKLQRHYKKGGFTEKESQALQDLEDKYLEKLKNF